MIVSSAATIVRSNCSWNSEKTPTTTTASWNSDTTAPTANCHSKRSQT